MKRACIAFAMLAATAGLLTHGSWAADAKPTYVKQLFCVACHRALNKEDVARYEQTKHASVKPEKGMAPVEIYRRSVGFNPADNTYFEAGVGCQDCHGPGSAHLAAQKVADKLATMPRPDKLKTAHERLSVCGHCHGDYTVDGKPYVVNFAPGDDMFAMKGFKLAKVTKPGPFQELNDFMTSKHATTDMSCLTCHSGHEVFAGKPQLNKAVPELCLQCHTKTHPCTLPEAQWPKGSTCVTCHMPNGRHTFSIPK